ncbi:MAG: transcriptional repressor [Thermoleophilaceae bacterium]
MTTAPAAAPVTFSTIDEAVAAMRRGGLRMSTVRRLILEALFAADKPLSTHRIARELKLDTASVYRNLEAMERQGIARHVHLGHGPGLYVLIGRGEHGYLHCESCGSVRAASLDDLGPVRSKVRELFGYEVRFSHFPIVGLCSRCVDRTPADDRTRS